MELMTKEIEQALLLHPYTHETPADENAEVIVAYYGPYGRGNWLITAGTQMANGDWMLFGLCCLYEWEWGPMMLSDLQQIVNVPPYGLSVERDILAHGTVKELKQKLEK